MINWVLIWKRLRPDYRLAFYFRLEMKTPLSTLLLTFLFCQCYSHQKRLDMIYKWKTIEFEFSNPAEREEMIKNKSFIPGNSVPIDVDTWKNGTYSLSWIFACLVNSLIIYPIYIIQIMTTGYSWPSPSSRTVSLHLWWPCLTEGTETSICSGLILIGPGIPVHVRA